MDEPRASYIEWSKSEKEKQASYKHHILIHVYGILKKKKKNLLEMDLWT